MEETKSRPVYIVDQIISAKKNRRRLNIHGK